MLQLPELGRCAQAIEARFCALRLERVIQPDPTSVVLCFRGRSVADERNVKRFLLLCCDREFGRVSELAAAPRAPETPPAFASYLRAHAVGARLTGAHIRGSDRQLALEFESRGEPLQVLLSLMGARSNVYALDADDVLRASVRPVEQCRRDLALGRQWSDPANAAPVGGDDRFAEVGLADYLQAIESAYAPQVAQRQSSQVGAHLLRALRKERKGAGRRLERIEAELAEADRASELQRHGELLKTVLGRIPSGAEVVSVVDPANGEAVAIPLDPALSPAANLQATFKRYQKFVRRLSKAGGQIEELRARIAELDEWMAQAQAACEPGGGDLDALLENAELARLLKKYESVEPSVRPEHQGPKLPKRLQGLASRLMPRRYLSRDGLEIWVGRSDAGNDHLTTRLARGNDLFFHLDGAPGSHVILCTEGRGEVAPESILDACQLAVRFSKQKNASRADVHVVPIKQVKKPKGAKPGLVWVTGGRTVHLRCDDERLKRLFAARIDS